MMMMMMMVMMMMIILISSNVPSFSEPPGFVPTYDHNEQLLLASLERELGV